MKIDKDKSDISFSGTLRKNYWESIYDQKKLTEVGWYQPSPALSLEFINKAGLPKEAKIIDIGAGDGLLTDNLIEQGFTNLTVLDISSKAIEKAKLRLGEKAKMIKWICSDIIDFEPEEKYDFWHDRACFHFLTEKKEIETYRRIVSKALNMNGLFVLGTFSKTGPTKCSGLDIQQYDKNDLRLIFSDHFDTVECVESVHHTPSMSSQNYVFCSFKRSSNNKSY